MTRIESIDGKYVNFPERWDDITAKQARFIFRTFERCIKSEASPLEFNVRVLLKILGIKARKIPRCKYDDYGEKAYLLIENHMGFLFDENSNPPRLSFDSLTNPMPCIGLRHGPGFLCCNLTFGEFRHAAMSVKMFSETGAEEHLEECLAILYRLPVTKENKAGRRAAKLGGKMFRLERLLAKHTAEWRKQLALAWFCNTIDYLQRGTVIIDGEEVNMSLLFDGGSSKGPGCTWNDLLIQLAKDGAIGSISDVDEEPLFSIFQILWSNYKEFKRYEETTKTNKRQ